MNYDEMSYDDLRNACCECRRHGCDFYINYDGELVCSCFECSFYKMYDLIKHDNCEAKMDGDI